MNRRTMIAALAFCLTLALGAAGAKAQEFYRLATLGPGSSPYLVMSTFAQMVNSELDDVEIQVNATGVATQHAIEAANGKLDFFMMAPIVHDLMLRQAAMYAKIPDAPELAKNLRGVFIFPLGMYHIVVAADSGIETLADLKGKRVFLGPPGGSATVTMRRFVEGVTGLKGGEDYEEVSVGWDSATQAFQDGRIDVYANPTNAPSPVIEQLALSREIRLLGVSREDLEKEGVAPLIERAGGTFGMIPAGTYGDNQVNDEDVLTIGSFVGVGTAVHVPEDEVYRITKAFWESVEGSREGTPWLRQISLDTAFNDLNMPLHPGAEKYYREIGVEIPDTVPAAE